MSDYIDPRTKPWGEESPRVYEWMKAQWEASVQTHWVPDTEENRIKEYKAVTKWFKQKYRQEEPRGLDSLHSLKQWIKNLFDSRKVDYDDHHGDEPRTKKKTKK